MLKNWRKMTYKCFCPKCYNGIEFKCDEEHEDEYVVCDICSFFFHVRVIEK